MKKSKAVPATLVTTVAAVMISSGCSGPTQIRRCVDERGNVMPDSYCESGTRSVYYGTGYHSPRWIYGGTMSGNRVTGYSTTPADGATVKSSTGRVISRGGFGGGSSSSFGG